ncbi:MAG TPA: hypothetical protein VJT84_11760 [Gaiellaceae bacterium]|nr:hypothetical protein [Gaiellaceae bacterium]
MSGGHEETRCTAVVDGSLILTEAGAIAYADVRVPRVPMPGSAYLRIVNQRLVQDRVIRFERAGTDREGNTLAQVWVDGENVNERIAAEAASLAES